jgi:hypothetical protein
MRIGGRFHGTDSESKIPQVVTCTSVRGESFIYKHSSTISSYRKPAPQPVWFQFNVNPKSKASRLLSERRISIPRCLPYSISLPS